MTKRRKTAAIVSGVIVSSIIVFGAYSSFTTSGAELKERRFGQLPEDIDRLKVNAVYPDDPNAQEVYFEYASPSLYGELDALLEFRSVRNAELNTAHACLGDAMIYFYRGDELCQLRWNYAHGDFFHPGLLTSKSKKNLTRWFESIGFAMFSKEYGDWVALRARSDANMVVH
jgi:hypothetical protein